MNVAKSMVRRQAVRDGAGGFDAVAVKYAVQVNGIEAFALTKLDVLDGQEEIKNMYWVSLWR